MLPRTALRKSPSSPLLASGGCQKSSASLGLRQQQHCSGLLLLPCDTVLSRMSVRLPKALLIRTPGIGFRTHPNPVLPHLNWNNIAQQIYVTNIGSSIYLISHLTNVYQTPDSALTPSHTHGTGASCRGHRGPWPKDSQAGQAHLARVISE